MALEVFSRRFILGALLSGVATRTLAGAPEQSLRPQPRGNNDPLIALKQAVRPAQELIGEAGLGGNVSYVVADARTGLVLESRASLRRHPPASVTKTITALYALDALGAEFRFATKLVATGPLQNGIIQGDLVLEGGGDPVLNTDYLADMARNLKEAGVRGVKGQFQVYAGALPFIPVIDRGQPDHLGYNPSVSGLNLNFNRVHFEWKRGAGGYDVAMDARSERYRPAVSMAKMQIVDRDLPIYTFSSGQEVDHWTVAQKALGKGGSRWLPVRHPAVYAAEVFQTLARAQGIRLKQAQIRQTRPNGLALVEHQSAPLSVILKGLLKYSTNLTAEVVGLTATQARGVVARSLSESAREMNRWMHENLGTTQSRFVDHSGLEESNRTTAHDMVGALVKEGPGSPLSRLLKQIPMRDAKGRKIKDHPVRVRAKTGTLNFVSALAGYVTAPDGTELAFAIFASDMERRAGITRSDREIPKGAKGWNKRAKRMQQGLIERWIGLYGI